jgi:glycosyltransferase involved in cell wall biosynthesis
MSRVDVIIPCYNYGRYLPGCVESVLGQDDVDVRVLIIDDASPDGSGHVAEELARRESRVEARRHAVNRGHIATYNEGLDWAAGDYLLLLSADDLLAPGALRRAARALDAHPEVGLTYGRQVQFSSDAPPTAGLATAELATAERGWRILSGGEFLEWCCRTGQNPVTTPTAVVRTALQKRLGGYRKELVHTGDMELWLRFAVHAAVAVIDADQAYKRMHSSNMQHQYLGSGLGDLPHRHAAFESLFSEYGSRLPDGPRLHARALASLAEEAFWAASRAFDRGDLPSYEQCLDYAVRLNPGLPTWPPWGRLRWKRRLGPRLWSVSRLLLERLRRPSRPAITG